MKNAILWILGGLCVASGFVAGLSGGFGVDGGDIAQVYSTLGYDGVDDIKIRGGGMFAILLVGAGLGMIVTANAGAWRETGGY